MAKSRPYSLPPNEKDPPEKKGLLNFKDNNQAN
jgi:hypothetical protein